MLSLSREEAASDNSRTSKKLDSDRFWQPQLSVLRLLPGFSAWDDQAEFSMAEEGRRYRPEGDPASPEYIPVRIMAKHEQFLTSRVSAQHATTALFTTSRSSLAPQTLNASSEHPNWGWSSYVGELEVQLLQPKFNYYKYPFDGQTIVLCDSRTHAARYTWTIEVSGNNGDPVHLFNCHGGGITSNVLRGMNLTRTPLRVHGEEVTLDEVLLPATGEWLLDGDLEDAVRDREILTTFRAPFTLTQASVFFAQIWLFHELDDEGNPKLHTCKVELYIRRNPMVYFIKGVLLTIAVVLGSLLTAGYLHPEEHIGDRCAVLFIAFLILITNSTPLGFKPRSFEHVRPIDRCLNPCADSADGFGIGTPLSPALARYLQFGPVNARARR
eukprot:7383925-Prymnesium_polylepis.1